MNQKALETLLAFNNTLADYPKHKTLVDLFEEQVQAHPDSVALLHKGLSFTYRQLNESANQLAHYLRSAYDIEKEDRIAIKLERSEWMIIAILGVLKAGAAYVPIDPGFQQERIDYMKADSQCKVLIDSVVLQFIKQHLDQFEKANPQKLSDPKSLAYVIYTSGSTGRPKGVMVEHQGIVNRIEWMWKQYGYTHNDVILQKTTFTFDVSVWEIFMPLCWGCQMVLCEKEDVAAPQRILSLIKTHKVTCLHFVPSMLSVFITALFGEAAIQEDLSSLRCVITSGEALPAKTVQNWYQKIEAPIHNLYGPTEASVDVTYYETRKGDAIIPIGKPIWNTQIHIVDESNNRVAIGEMGEICIAGDGLARGYINKPELTAEKFVSNPFQEGTRMYKTGDYGRWLPDGNIEYLGRKDDQVKIRGYRIELGEIEKVWSSHPGINQCVVVNKKVGETNRLIGYYVPDWEYIEAQEKALYNRQVANWQELFESEYQKTETRKDVDAEFNFIGWGDSFTGKLIPEAHMREWLNDITTFIKVQKPERVLEIGCGTGMIFFQLAGSLKKYIGTDLSASGINQIKSRIHKGIREYGATDFKVCAAHEIELNSEEQVDTIILNSIVQFFSGKDYLTQVIEKCIALLKGKGRIIIGDVRDYRLLEAFKARLLAQKQSEETSIKAFKDELEQQVLKEEEICFAPDYFYSLCSRFPDISFVDIEGKQGDSINELTLYRYNVVLHVGVEKERVAPNWKSWKGVADKDHILAEINENIPQIALKGVPNLRLWKERLMAAGLKDTTIKTVKELIQTTESEDAQTIAIKEVLNVAKTKGYTCRLLPDTDPMKWNVVLDLHRSDSFMEPVYEVNGNSRTFTNVPLFNDINVLLQKEVKAYLHKYLPEYMVPTDFMALRSMPLNANGKADKKALPEMNVTIFKSADYTAPRNKIEKVIAAVWSELLGIKTISVFDNFFDLGGNSLMAVQVMARLERELGAKLPLAILFQHATVQKLAELFLAQHDAISWNSLVAVKPNGTKPPLYFVHGANGDVLFLRTFSTQIHPEQPLYALRPQGVSGNGKFLNTVEEMASHYIKEILKQNPNGPYALSGYSFGGYVAFEMARQLKAMGKEVSMLALFDTDALRSNYQRPLLNKIARRLCYPFLRIAHTIRFFKEDRKGQWTYEKEKVQRWLSLQKRKFLSQKNDYHYYRLALEWKCKKARDQYKMQPLDIAVELFRAERQTFLMQDPVYLGWKKFAKRGVNVHQVPGAHHLIFMEPNGTELGQMLQYSLDQAVSQTKGNNIVVLSASLDKECNNRTSVA